MSRLSLTACSFPGPAGRGEAGCDCSCACVNPPRGCPSPPRQAGRLARGPWAGRAEMMSNVMALALVWVWDAIAAPLGLLEEPRRRTALAAASLGARLPPSKPPLRGVLASPGKTCLEQCCVSAFAVSVCLSRWFVLVLVLGVFLSSPRPAGFRAPQQSSSSLPIRLACTFSVLHCCTFHVLSTAFQVRWWCAKASQAVDMFVSWIHLLISSVTFSSLFTLLLVKSILFCLFWAGIFLCSCIFLPQVSSLFVLFQVLKV